MNEFTSNEASLRKRGGIFIVRGYLMPLRVGNELLLGNGLESDPAEPIRIFISPSCLCFFVFATCFHSLQNSFHVEENMNNPSLLLQFQPPTETDELALSHPSAFPGKRLCSAKLGQLTAFGQWGSLDSQSKHGCCGLPMELWQEAS